MRRWRSLVAAGAAAATIAGLTFGGAAAQTPSPSGSAAGKLTFTIGDDNDLDSMNPFVAVEAPAFQIFFLTYDFLVNLSQEDLSPSPGLAESWDQSDDGLTWTFQIRDDATWHDGEPVTAHDVEYTYNRIIEEEQGSFIDYISLIDTIEVPDDQTVVITTKEPTLQLLTALVFILPEHIWKDISTEEAGTFENNPPVGSGPFKVVEWEKGQFYRMESVPEYWGGAPRIDEFVYRIFNNEDALVQALRAGEVDFADSLNANPFNSLKETTGITTHEANIPSFDEIGFNVGANDTIPDADGHPALLDVRVRQAMAHAIDKQVILDRVLQGYGTIGTTIVPPFSAAYHYEPTEEELFEFDLEEANRILDEAGYEDTDGDDVREMPDGGQPLMFRYFVRSENNSTVQTSQFVQDWFNQIGIATEVEALDDTTLTDAIFEGKYDMFHWGWFPDPDPDFILSIFTCGQRPPDGIWSDSFYCDEEYDRMYQEQKTVADVEGRAQIIFEMQKQLYEDAAYIVLYYDANLQAYRSDRWTGFLNQPEPDGDLLSGYGNYTFVNLRPVTKAAAGDEEEGGSAFTWVWVGLVAGPLLLVAVALLIRRRKGEEDRA
ncbi:ABC transporter substrate-binding protein [soil metagenome]